MKQAVAPKKPLDELWEWAGEQIQPDVISLTEAKVPKDGVPHSWSALWDSNGIYPTKRNGKWGTVLASRSPKLVPVKEVKTRWRKKELKIKWPASLQVADIYTEDKHWGTIVALYAANRSQKGFNFGNGYKNLSIALKQLEPLFESTHGDRIILAGDFNCWPDWISSLIEKYNLVDLIEETASTRKPLPRCANCASLEGIDKPDNFISPTCGHLWTHKNGNSDNAKVQQIDFLLSTHNLLDELNKVYGGIEDFPDAWQVSDHAPVVAEFI
tara:strand:+ start:145 stop:954 length:810 start_codon:yes stop_codon:yes gene_type:complete